MLTIVSLFLLMWAMNGKWVSILSWPSASVLFLFIRKRIMPDKISHFPFHFLIRIQLIASQLKKKGKTGGWIQENERGSSGCHNQSYQFPGIIKRKLIDCDIQETIPFFSFGKVKPQLSISTCHYKRKKRMCWQLSRLNLLKEKKDNLLLTICLLLFFILAIIRKERSGQDEKKFRSWEREDCVPARIVKREVLLDGWQLTGPSGLAFSHQPSALSFSRAGTEPGNV